MARSLSFLASLALCDSRVSQVGRLHCEAGENA